MRKQDVGIFLRLVIGLFVLLGGGWLGYGQRSPWLVPWLGLAYTALYIAGKWHVWKHLWHGGGAGGWLRALAATYPVQLVLAALVYLVGLGLGRLFTSGELATQLQRGDFIALAIFAAMALALALVVNVLEGGRGAAATIVADMLEESTAGRHAAVEDEGADFVVTDEVITPANLLSAARYGYDYARIALLEGTLHDGRRPQKVPFAASELAIRRAEQRLGFTLPQTLKAIYRHKDGGLAKELFVAAASEPRPVYEDWKSAFGGYESLYAVGELRTVHDSFLDFTGEDDTEAFPEGAKRLLVLAQWYRETTFLDYRKDGEPRVGIVDFDREDWQDTALWFDSFDVFVAALRRVDSDQDRLQPARVLGQHGPSAAEPDAFWVWSVRAADHGVDETLWRQAQGRLGKTLPAALRPFLAAVNGGLCLFDTLPGRGEDGGELYPFPEHYLAGVQSWLSLRELSGRLEFAEGDRPWAERWPDSEHLVVMSASYDRALLLDYRQGARQTENQEGEPRVLSARNLDDPAAVVDLGTPADFVRALRAEQNPHWGSAPVGDPRLSARSAAAPTFWMPGPPAGAVGEEQLASAVERLGLVLPQTLVSWLGVSNGGAVRFRYQPPLRPNPAGYLNPVPTEREWIDLFPDGIAPLERWQTLADWNSAHGEDFGEALRQRAYSQFVRDEYGDPVRVLVIAQGRDRLCLLDASREHHADNACVVLLRREAGTWRETYRSAGLRALALRARRDEW
ncbi:MAG: SMI1/KNR4 family protein [Parahaliea sp.]